MSLLSKANFHPSPNVLKINFLKNDKKKCNSLREWGNFKRISEKNDETV